MEPPPISYDIETLRDEKVKVLKAISPILPSQLIRGQFRGYRSEAGVAPDSNVETFCRAEATRRFLALARSAFLHPCREEFARQSHGSSSQAQATPAHRSRTRTHIQLRAVSPQPRLHNSARSISTRTVGIDAWTRLGTGCDAPSRWRRDGRLRGVTWRRLARETFRFARQDYVLEAWRIVEFLLNLNTRPTEYEPGSWGPPEAQTLIPEGWLEGKPVVAALEL